MKHHRDAYPPIHDAEAGVLGGILIGTTDPLELLAGLPELAPEDFDHARHQSVFAAMRNLEARPGSKVDLTTVEMELARMGKLDSLGGVAFLGELACRCTTPTNVIDYASYVKDASQQRRLQRVLSELLAEAKSGEMTADEILSDAEAALGEIDQEQPTDAISIGEITGARWKQVEALAEARARGELALSGVPTGVAGLDEKIGGYQSGIVHLIAARPSMGKSSLALAGAEAASFASFGVHVFSQEDSREAYGDRALSRQSGIPAENIRNADVTGRDGSHVVAAVARYRTRPGWIVDFTTGLTAEQIVRRARRHKRANGTRVVFVDYVQLVRKRDPRQSDNEAWAEVVTTFADAAGHDDMAYVVLSQLNRDLEKRSDKRPQLQDLRGSGGLEERPRVVIAIYRGAFYGGEPQRHVDWDCDCAEGVKVCVHKPTHEQWERQAQLLVLKNTNGRRGRVWAAWDGPTTRIW